MNERCMKYGLVGFVIGLIIGTVIWHPSLKDKGKATANAQFETWKTIKLGTARYQSGEAYSDAMKAEGIHVKSAGKFLIDFKLEIANQEKEVELVLVPLKSLGFDDGLFVSFLEICMRASKLGLELCPEEVGPALRLAYHDQPKAYSVKIAMEPISDEEDCPRIFEVGCDEVGNRYIAARVCHSAYFTTKHRFVFVKTRK